MVPKLDHLPWNAPHILGRIFTKLDMMNGHGSVTMPIDGRHGPVITAVTVW